MTHVCTNKSLRAGIDLPPMECSVCGCNTMFASWVDISCDTCGANTGYFTSDLVRVVRQRMGLSRKEIAIKSGLKSSTIKSYEWKVPSKKYFEWFLLFVREFYKNNSGE